MAGRERMEKEQQSEARALLDFLFWVFLDLRFPDN